MYIVTVKNIDVDSFALPTLYGKTTLQKYNFSMNPQEDKLFFFFGGDAAGVSLFGGTSQQPCHASDGLCDGGHLWLRHTGISPSQYENLTLHIGVW